MSGVPHLSRRVAIAAIGADGLTDTIETTAAERAGLAAALGLVEIGALSAEVTLRREPKGTILVEGGVKAAIVQNCVFSLEPVAQSIDEPISVRFVQVPADEPASAKPGAEVRIDPSEDDPPEPIAGPVIDLGPIVVEHFVLAIDPYPRAPGAALPDNPAEAPEDRTDSPFAALAGLGRRGPEKL